MSSRAGPGGFVRQQGRDPVEMPMMIACNKLWQSLSQELSADLEWVQGGNLALAKDEESIQRFEESAGISRQFGLDTRLLSREEVGQLIPALEGPFIGGMYTPGGRPCRADKDHHGICSGRSRAWRGNLHPLHGGGNRNHRR